MKNYLAVLILFFFLSAEAKKKPVEIKPSQQFLVLTIPDNGSRPGMFSIFRMVLGFFEYYEQNFWGGMQIDFGERGIYYDPSMGPNWWEYYFEPIEEGGIQGKKIKILSYILQEKFFEIGERLPRKRAFGYLSKYVKIKPEIQKEVEEFREREFKEDFVIGVHYRGTDKKIEKKRVAYERIYKEILSIQRKEPNIKIFVATDEQAFVDDIREHFKGRVIFTNAYRSSDGAPVHLDTSSPYLRGKEAIIDCLLLSQTNILIRTPSYLSLFSTFFNPELPVILLSE